MTVRQDGPEFPKRRLLAYGYLRLAGPGAVRRGAEEQDPDSRHGLLRFRLRDVPGPDDDLLGAWDDDELGGIVADDLAVHREIETGGGLHPHPPGPLVENPPL